MRKLESDVVRSAQEWVDALGEARRSFRGVERSTLRALKMVNSGKDVLPSMLDFGAGPTRDAVNATLEDLEERRHDLRLKIFALALSEGYSISQIGRMFGFSRQLASRYAREASRGS